MFERSSIAEKWNIRPVEIRAQSDKMKALFVICVAAVFHMIFVASHDDKDCDEVSMNQTTR